MDKLMDTLKERAKELKCLYRIEEILSDYDMPMEDICPKVMEAIPHGWQYTDICVARIRVDDIKCTLVSFDETPWVQKADIVVNDAVIGVLEVYYTEERPTADDGPFLADETRLINTIAERIGYYITHKNLRRVIRELDTSRTETSRPERREWEVILDMYKQADHKMYMDISRKMLNHLCWQGVTEAEELYLSLGSDDFNRTDAEASSSRWQKYQVDEAISEGTYHLVAQHLDDDVVLKLIQKWVQEDKLFFIIQVVNRNLPLSEVVDAVRRYYHMHPQEKQMPAASLRGIQVSLTRRLLSYQLSYINIARKYIDISDFHHLTEKLVHGFESHGMLGGKSAGLYLASQILKHKAEKQDLLKDIKAPKTWYLTADVMLYFMHYDDFDQIVEQKYKNTNQVRLEYPHIIRSFKRARFPADIISGLSLVLDDFGDNPIIVRSSSLLEDRMGATFAGLYKSIFLANQGSKKERLLALKDAIAEVYASIFGPDPIDYRAERGLLDYSEEMGIMIQEVVGRRAGRYFLPAYAGVAFSRNEFPWSPLVKRTDGLVRMVPGLGTRAVERTSEDYPVLIAPGQPNLRVNTTVDEVLRYSPRMIDVINLETGRPETVEIDDLLEEVGEEFPRVREIFSVHKDGHIYQSQGVDVDFGSDRLIATFNGLIARTPFIKQVDAILRTLEETLGYPVDIEFASDGEHFYLLQCRPQVYPESQLPAPIPMGISHRDIIFSANKYITNGQITNISHIVYVDPKQYAALETDRRYNRVREVIGLLNDVLPRRQFILMGPGRWGSRGDLSLGIDVTYSDINNTALLVEMAFAKGNVMPDLSFGTHFLQDLMESKIPYLPLYPESEDVIFREEFLAKSPGILTELLPDFADMKDVVRVIDIAKVTHGMTFQVHMNGHLDKAVGIVTRRNQ